MLSLTRAAFKNTYRAVSGVPYFSVSYRSFSETVCQKTEKEMMSAFPEMRQAKDLVEKRVFKEAEQLYSRVYDIVSSFSPENSPMLDVVNRKKLELYTRSNRVSDAIALIKKLNQNVESRGDQVETQAEKSEFVKVLLNLGQVMEAGVYANDLNISDPTPSGLSSFLLSTLQKHLSGEEVCSSLESRRVEAQKLGKRWELHLLNNLIACRWDTDVDRETTSSLCKDVELLVKSMEEEGMLHDTVLEEARQALNTAGGYLLSLDKRDDAGDLLKYSLRLSDNNGITLSENITSSNTLGLIASIVYKQDQIVMSEGLYLQALEVFSKKEKKMSLDAFSRPELFDYKSLCDGYSHLLLSWEKREPLGEKYQQQAVDLLMRVNDGADWMFPLTSHFCRNRKHHRYPRGSDRLPGA